jgi:hypothetical protein
MASPLSDLKAECFNCQKEDYKIDMIEAKDGFYFCSDCIAELTMDLDKK